MRLSGSQEVTLSGMWLASFTRPVVGCYSYTSSHINYHSILVQMPRKSKRQLQCAAARAAAIAAKRRRKEAENPNMVATNTALSSSHTVSISCPNQTRSTARGLAYSTSSKPETSATSTNPSTASTQEHTDSEPDSDTDSTDNGSDPRTKDEILRQFCNEWMAKLNHHDLQSLGVFLCYLFTQHFSMQATDAAILVSSIIGKSDKSVRRWRTSVIRNKGVLPSSKQGKYERKGLGKTSKN